MKAETTCKPPPVRQTAGLLASWGSQLIQIASGFAIPRMIDGGVGPVALGVWDLGWSLVSYFTLLEGGVGSSLNRFIALERGKGDQDGVNRCASTAAVIQRTAGALILLVTCLLAWVVPFDFKCESSSLAGDARWLVFLLGSSSGLSMLAAVYSGVLTGCEKWTCHYSIHAAMNSLSVIAMLSVLALGHGIVSLGVVHLVTEVTGRMIRRHMAYRYCPGLRISSALSNRATVRAMLGFGGRMAVGRISRMLLVQTTNVLIASYLGPASLALFSRPRSLIRQAAVFPEKYAFLLVPGIASLLGTGAAAEIRRFVETSCRTGLYLALPIVLYLLILGPELVRIWMGDNYADPILVRMVIMAFAFEACYLSLDHILLGLNLHGRPALVMLIASAISILASWILLSCGFGLRAVVVAIVVPWTFAHAFYLPYHVCVRLGIGLGKFLLATWTGPLACGVPFAMILLGSMLIFPHRTLLGLIAGTASAGTFLVLSYWLWVIPESLRSEILRRPLGSGSKSIASAPDRQEGTWYSL